MSRPDRSRIATAPGSVPCYCVSEVSYLAWRGRYLQCLEGRCLQRPGVASSSPPALTPQELQQFGKSPATVTQTILDLGLKFGKCFRISKWYKYTIVAKSAMPALFQDHLSFNATRKRSE